MSTPPDRLSPSPPSEPEPPTLDPEVVADDETLAAAVDAFIAADAEARERLYELVDLQEALRGAVDADLWRLILRIDELVTARWADLSVGIARWAFAEGRTCPGVTPGDPDGPPQGAS